MLEFGESSDHVRIDRVPGNEQIREFDEALDVVVNDRRSVMADRGNAKDSESGWIEECCEELRGEEVGFDGEIEHGQLRGSFNEGGETGGKSSSHKFDEGEGGVDRSC